MLACLHLKFIVYLPHYIIIIFLSQMSTSYNFRAHAQTTTETCKWNKLESLLLFVVHRRGFEEERIEALLHKIEIQMKHQSTNFGLSLASVSSLLFMCNLRFVSTTTTALHVLINLHVGGLSTKPRMLVCVFCDWNCFLCFSVTLNTSQEYKHVHSYHPVREILCTKKLFADFPLLCVSSLFST